MPLEISEIGVRVAVGQGAGPSGSGSGPGPAHPPAPAGNGNGALTPARQEEIVEACVQRVLQTLRLRESR